ncbi:hypothetical protein RHGRI_007277 [Rhododendron griersonianum]|uniref:holo-[acyl-carrier-protein] synthase n=1 Tax=Rhododendron griersonianum TaxID=479676 RepID=A0AAV6KWD6_9ERIC|nr:hypothetical protein RHGRI_007277 [Rhododendron griersonianum]
MLDKLIRLSHLLFVSVSKHLFILTDEKGKFDELVQDKGVKILVDPKALMHVIGTKMDFVDDKLRYQQLRQGGSDLKVMQMELQKGVQRWVVDISQWNPSSQEFSHAMSFLPQHEHPSITGLEWDSIMNAGSCDDMLNEFYRYWCVKEAFVKAIGTGVGYRLDSVEFHHTRWTNIFVKLDGKELKEWRFWLYELGKRHMVSIAKGHPNNATENYKRTLKRTEFDEEHYHLGLHLPNVSFVQRTVEQLIPVSSKSRGVNLGQ